MKTPMRRWLALLFAVSIVLTIAVAVGWSYATGYKIIMDHSEADALNCFGFVASLLDMQDPALITAPDAELPQDVKDDFRRVSDAFDMTFLYVYRVNTNMDHRYYLLATRMNDDGTFLNAIRSIEKENGTAIDDLERDALDGGEDSHRYVLKNEFGFNLSWLVPYKDGEGNVLALIGGEYDLTMIHSEILEQSFTIAIPIVIVQLLAFAILMLSINRRITKPIARISEAMKRFAEKHERPEERPAGRSVAEIAGIEATFDSMSNDVLDYIEDNERLARERAEDEAQELVARRIQYGLVPEELQLDGDGFDLFARTKPAKAVGGDFYDCFRLDDGRICVTIGDVSGKGVSAALFMAIAKTDIHDLLRGGLTPAQALMRANNDLCSMNPEGLFATVFTAVFDPATGRLDYANAGHNYPAFAGGGKADFLHPQPGIALGLFEDAQIDEETATLEPGMTLFLYTDGVTEAVNRNREFFGEERLLDALSIDADTAQGTVGAVSDALNAYCGDCDPFDDTAMLALRRSAANDDFETLPADRSAFPHIKKRILSAPGEPPKKREILLCCEEILANIVSYAGVPTFRFRFSAQGDGYTAVFEDGGPAFDPTQPRETPGFDALDTGGMGLGLVRQIADKLDYSRIDETNVLTMLFALK